MRDYSKPRERISTHSSRCDYKFSLLLLISSSNCSAHLREQNTYCLTPSVRRAAAEFGETRIENDEDFPLRQYDKILFHPKEAIPVDFETDNQLFVVPVEDVVAVFRRETGKKTTKAD